MYIISSMQLLYYSNRIDSNDMSIMISAIFKITFKRCMLLSLEFNKKNWFKYSNQLKIETHATKLIMLRIMLRIRAMEDNTNEILLLIFCYSQFPIT